LPGIIADQFFKALDSNKDREVSEKEFIKGFTKVFVSDLDTKLQLTFDM